MERGAHDFVGGEFQRAPEFRSFRRRFVAEGRKAAHAKGQVMNWRVMIHWHSMI